MRKFAFSSVLAATVLGLGSGSVLAADENGSSSAAKLKQLDKDGDGRLSPAEFSAGRQPSFDKRDANRDGVVSAEEKAANAGMSDTVNSARGAIARNTRTPHPPRDGQLSAATSGTDNALFTKLDIDGDGYLTAMELDAGYGRGASAGNPPTGEADRAR